MAELAKGLIEGPDGVVRCWWHGNLPDYLAYHDREWGRPVADDRRLFEKLCLEGFQSGLSWLTILRKRENFRAGFAGFDYDRVAEFGEADIERLLAETGTVVLKFMLHIGFDEQRERLQERVDDVTKHWKFSLGDLDVRQQWAQYQKAYEDLLEATSTDWAPWTVVPANSKTHRNLMIATIVRDTLKALDLRFPPEDPALKGLRIE